MYSVCLSQPDISGNKRVGEFCHDRGKIAGPAPEINDGVSGADIWSGNFGGILEDPADDIVQYK